MSYAFDRFETEAEARAALPDLFADDGLRQSVALRVTAYGQLAEYGEPDDAGEQKLIQPARESDGYWLLHQSAEGDDPITLPEGIIAVSPLFAGMSAPLTA